MNKKYTKEILEEAVKDKTSMSEVIRHLGLKITGGNFTHLKNNLNKFNIDVSHFLGQRCNKNKTPSNKMTKEVFIKRYLKILPEYKSVTTNRIKLRLLEFKIKNHICEKCSNTHWNNKLIPLELHHIDGCRWNNNINNLQLLCPNCHAQTDNYCKNARVG